MKELLVMLKGNQRQLEKNVFLCCFISVFEKTVDVYCIFNNIGHFHETVFSHPR